MQGNFKITGIQVLNYNSKSSDYTQVINNTEFLFLMRTNFDQTYLSHDSTPNFFCAKNFILLKTGGSNY